MKKHFYSHILEIDSLQVSLDLLDLTPKEKEELIAIAETSIHHVVIDIILSELKEEHKRIFLTYLSRDDHANIWIFLNQNINNVEDKLRRAINDFKKELHQDIQEAKKKSS